MYDVIIYFKNTLKIDLKVYNLYFITILKKCIFFCHFVDGRKQMRHKFSILNHVLGLKLHIILKYFFEFFFKFEHIISEKSLYIDIECFRFNNY